MVTSLIISTVLIVVGIRVEVARRPQLARMLRVRLDNRILKSKLLIVLPIVFVGGDY